MDDLVTQDIFTLMGVQNMPDDQKQALYKQMEETIQKRALATVHDTLPEADRAQFKELIDTGTPEQLVDFLHVRSIDLNDVLTKEAMRYKAEMADAAQPMRQAAQSPNN